MTVLRQPGLRAISVLQRPDQNVSILHLPLVGGCPQTCLLPLQTIAHCPPLHWWINIVTVLGIFQMHFWDLEST